MSVSDVTGVDPCPPCTWVQLNTHIQKRTFATSVVRLHISHSAIPDSPWLWLINVLPALENMIELDLAGTAMTDVRCRTLIEALSVEVRSTMHGRQAQKSTSPNTRRGSPALHDHRRSLVSLNVAQNELTERSAQPLGRWMTQCEALQLVDASHNRMGDHGAQVLSAHLKMVTSQFVNLAFANNGCSIRGIVDLLVGASEAPNLHDLNLSGNHHGARRTSPLRGPPRHPTPVTRDSRPAKTVAKGGEQSFDTPSRVHHATVIASPVSLPSALRGAEHMDPQHRSVSEESTVYEVRRMLSAPQPSDSSTTVSAVPVEASPVQPTPWFAHGSRHVTPHARWTSKPVPLPRTVLQRLRRGCALAVLNLNDCGLTAEHAVDLVPAILLSCPRLGSLWIHDNPVGDAATWGLAAAVSSLVDESFTLRQRPSAWEHHQDGGAPSVLRRLALLDMSLCDVSDTGLAHVADALCASSPSGTPALKRLEELCVAGCFLTADGVVSFLTALFDGGFVNARYATRRQSGEIRPLRVDASRSAHVYTLDDLDLAQQAVQLLEGTVQLQVGPTRDGHTIDLAYFRPVPDDSTRLMTPARQQHRSQQQHHDDYPTNALGEIEDDEGDEVPESVSALPHRSPPPPHALRPPSAPASDRYSPPVTPSSLRLSPLERQSPVGAGGSTVATLASPPPSVESQPHPAAAHRDAYSTAGYNFYTSRSPPRPVLAEADLPAVGTTPRPASVAAPVPFVDATVAEAKAMALAALARSHDVVAATVVVPTASTPTAADDAEKDVTVPTGAKIEEEVPPPEPAELEGEPELLVTAPTVVFDEDKTFDDAAAPALQTVTPSDVDAAIVTAGVTELHEALSPAPSRRSSSAASDAMSEETSFVSVGGGGLQTPTVVLPMPVTVHQHAHDGEAIQPSDASSQHRSPSPPSTSDAPPNGGLDTAAPTPTLKGLHAVSFNDSQSHHHDAADMHALLHPGPDEPVAAVNISVKQDDAESFVLDPQPLFADCDDVLNAAKDALPRVAQMHSVVFRHPAGHPCCCICHLPRELVVAVLSADLQCIFNALLRTPSFHAKHSKDGKPLQAHIHRVSVYLDGSASIMVRSNARREAINWCVKASESVADAAECPPDVVAWESEALPSSMELRFPRCTALHQWTLLGGRVALDARGHPLTNAPGADVEAQGIFDAFVTREVTEGRVSRTDAVESFHRRHGEYASLAGELLEEGWLQRAYTAAQRAHVAASLANVVQPDTALSAPLDSQHEAPHQDYTPEEATQDEALHDNVSDPNPVAASLPVADVVTKEPETTGEGEAPHTESLNATMADLTPNATRLFARDGTSPADSSFGSPSGGLLFISARGLPGMLRLPTVAECGAVMGASPEIHLTQHKVRSLRPSDASQVAGALAPWIAAHHDSENDSDRGDGSSDAGNREVSFEAEVPRVAVAAREEDGDSGPGRERTLLDAMNSSVADVRITDDDVRLTLATQADAVPSQRSGAPVLSLRRSQTSREPNHRDGGDNDAAEHRGGLRAANTAPTAPRYVDPDERVALSRQRSGGVDVTSSFRDMLRAREEGSLRRQSRRVRAVSPTAEGEEASHVHSTPKAFRRALSHYDQKRQQVRDPTAMSPDDASSPFRSPQARRERVSKLFFCAYYFESRGAVLLDEADRRKVRVCKGMYKDDRITVSVEWSDFLVFKLDPTVGPKVILYVHPLVGNVSSHPLCVPAIPVEVKADVLRAKAGVRHLTFVLDRPLAQGNTVPLVDDPPTVVLSVRLDSEWSATDVCKTLKEAVEASAQRSVTYTLMRNAPPRDEAGRGPAE